MPYLADHVALAISWFPYLSGLDLFVWMLRDLVPGLLQVAVEQGSWVQGARVDSTARYDVDQSLICQDSV